MYNPFDMNNTRDEVEAHIEARRLERDGFICRPISREIQAINEHTELICETRLELERELKEMDGER